ncbi:MAG: MFS transporter [Roseobacter sp.]
MPTDVRLSSYSLFAAMLATAGLPLYIHAPKFYVDEFGVSLASLGIVLFGLRLLDVVQDPLLGRLAEKTRENRSSAVAIGGVVMVGGMIALFAIPPLFSPLIWFGVCLTLVFSAFSFLTINFYAQGAIKAQALQGNGHFRLARWRESGALIGVCAASVAPVVLGFYLNAPFQGFAIGFAVLSMAALIAMRSEWSTMGLAPSTGFRAVLNDPLARRLLIISMLNAAPVAISSTLFLFFVESKLQAPGFEGPLLLIFFLSAALAAPFWSVCAERFGPRNVLLFAMTLAIGSFCFTFALGPGDWVLFALVCIASGIALGADLTLLPAIFAARMVQISPSASEGFGLWAFASKLTLAFAAVTLLPMLERAGFQSGSLENPPEALALLTVLYAAVPCTLKLIAIAVLAMTDLREA